MDEIRNEALDGSLIVIIFDANPGQPIYAENPKKFNLVSESLIAFSNAHLMMKGNNKVAFIACDSERSEFIFSDADMVNVTTSEKPDGQYELFGHVERRMKGNLKKFVSDLGRPGEALMAGACTMGLCYIQRLERELPANEKINSRLLIITGSTESASQYMTYMNAFFAAQKCNVIVDACALYQDLCLLQQGCEITGGIYLKIPQLAGILQYLMWVYLAEPYMRKKLVLPPAVRVDYRAACFCHRQLIDIGYTCCVCLSVFCKFSPICTTCHSLFKTPGTFPTKPKKKKQKVT